MYKNDICLETEEIDAIERKSYEMHVSNRALAHIDI